MISSSSRTTDRRQRSVIDIATQDVQLRQAAFEHVNRLAALNGDVLSSDDLAAGSGSALTAYLAVVLLTTALQGARQRRDRRGYERVMNREETLRLIESQAIAAAHRRADSAV